VSLTLRQPAGKQVLVVRGIVPKIGDADFKTSIDVRADDHSVTKKSVGLGDFSITIPMPAGEGPRRLQMLFSAVQDLPGGDGRSIGARIQSIGFEAPRAQGETRSSDIVQGADLHLGKAWGILETFHDETFRWVDNDAVIELTPATPGDERLSMLVEPGPGINGPFLLKVLDESGRRVDAVRVAHRDTVEIFLPTEPGKINTFRLHVDGGGKRIASDPRILNFRIFRIVAEQP
jgi:hypothetical protein